MAKRLETLFISLDVPEETILNLSVAETDGPSTSNGRYVLGGYDLGLAGSWNT